MSDPLATVPLSAIRLFETAARLRSFTKAAEALGVTQAAVSWQVKALEQRLGQPLFHRLPREVVLTAAGERLARAASEAMALLRSAVSDLSDQPGGVLSITSAESMAIQWLAPRIGGFQLAHPQIAVRLDTSATLKNLIHDGFDVAIRAGAGDWPGLESLYMFPAEMTPLCTPRVCADLGGLQRPEDLLGAPLIGLDRDWTAWFAAAGIERAEVTTGGQLIADMQSIGVSTALTGRGVALASPILFAPELASGRLVRPFQATVKQAAGFWLVYARDRRRASKIAAFRDWLTALVGREFGPV